MDEGGGYENARAEVPTDEQGMVRDWQLGEASNDQGKRTGEGREDEDHEEGDDVDGEAVLPVGVVRAAFRPFTLGLSSLELGVEKGYGQVGESCGDCEGGCQCFGGSGWRRMAASSVSYRRLELAHLVSSSRS